MSEVEDDEVVELTEDELQDMVSEAIDVLALALPEDAGDDYWRALRETVERRAKEMVVEDDGED